MGKHLIVAGHGGSDPGAVGNGINERDFTRSQVVDRIASVINNTKGHTAHVYNKKNNMFWDTQLGSGFGMYWAKSQGYTTVTEIHLDAASPSARGGHVIVHSNLAPDSIDLGIRNAIQKYVGVRYTHRGHTGISGRNNLLQVNVAANIGVNYRLVELGFITNSQDVRNIRNNIVALCTDIANAITGSKAASKPVATVKPAPKKDTSPNTTQTTAAKWRTNKYGTQYLKAKGTWRNGSVRVMSRFGSPFRSAPEGGWANPGWKCNYDEIVRQDGHIWLGYTVSGKRKYIPVKTWNSKTGAVGKDWGTFS